MKKLRSEKTLEKVNLIFGKLSSILVLILILLVSFSVILRYIFSLGFTWLQDLYIWVHASFLLLGIAYTLNKDAHVRIDILYRNFSNKKKEKINFFGSIFFGLPLCYFLIVKGYEYFLRSLLISEDSKESGGLPNIYFLKFLIFLMGILISLEILRNIIRFFSKND